MIAFLKEGLTGSRPARSIGMPNESCKNSEGSCNAVNVVTDCPQGVANYVIDRRKLAVHSDEILRTFKL